MAGWQKLYIGTKGLRWKVWTEILSPNLRFFVAVLKFVAILKFFAIFALFENFWAKECCFRSKTVFIGQEVHYYMVYIAYFTELILQICDYAQQRRIWRKNCKSAFDENFHCHFCSRRKAAKFFHPVRYNQKKGGYLGKQGRIQGHLLGKSRI